MHVHLWHGDVLQTQRLLQDTPPYTVLLQQWRELPNCDSEDAPYTVMLSQLQEPASRVPHAAPRKILRADISSSLMRSSDWSEAAQYGLVMYVGKTKSLNNLRVNPVKTASTDRAEFHILGCEGAEG